MAPTPSHLYTKHLTSEENGRPQLTPEPSLSLPLDYQLIGAQLGDTGFWRNGSFCPIFNICQFTEFCLNRQLDFTAAFPIFPLREESVFKCRWFSAGSVVTGGYEHDMKLQLACSIPGNIVLSLGGGAGLKVKHRFVSDAVLYLPDGAMREDLLDPDALQQHAIRFSKEILKFARGTGLLPPNTPLYIVTGTDKASCWEIHVRHTSAADIAADMHLDFFGASTSARWERDVGGGGIRLVRSSEGCRSVSAASPDNENQCVFIRGFELPLKSVNESWIGRWRVRKSRILGLFVNDERKDVGDNHPPTHIVRTQSSSGQRILSAL